MLACLRTPAHPSAAAMHCQMAPNRASSCQTEEVKCVLLAVVAGLLLFAFLAAADLPAASPTLLSTSTAPTSTAALAAAGPAARAAALPATPLAPRAVRVGGPLPVFSAPAPRPPDAAEGRALGVPSGPAWLVLAAAAGGITCLALRNAAKGRHLLRPLDKDAVPFAAAATRSGSAAFDEAAEFEVGCLGLGGCPHTVERHDAWPCCAPRMSIVQTSIVGGNDSFPAQGCRTYPNRTKIMPQLHAACPLHQQNSPKQLQK